MLSSSVLHTTTSFVESGAAVAVTVSLSPVSYTHLDAADEEDSVDLGGRRMLKKKKNKYFT